MGRDSWGAEQRVPMEVAPEDGAEFWSASWVAWGTTGFVALGILLRVARYLLKFPLWCDETMIAANFLDRGYTDLFRPLDYRQVSPVLFLVIELTSVKLLGFSELSLRLFPMVCGAASVPLFRHAAGRVLKGVPLLLAVGIFAVAGWPLRYAAEVKPYASDLFVALALLAMALEWWRAPGRLGWLWGLAVASPLAVALSLPSVFIVGGIGLALAIPVWRTSRPSAWLSYVLGNLSAVTMFLALAPFYKTAPQDHDYFHGAWAEAFPPLDNAWRLLVWLLDVHTGFMFAYPDGGAHGASVATFVGFAVAAVVLWSHRRRTVVALVLAPLALAMLAAAIHRYPYGVSARTTQYAAPGICLLSGLGAAYGLSRIRDPRARGNGLRIFAGVLAVLGFGRLAADMITPSKTVTDARVRSFAAWFWTELSRDGELACIRGDLGVSFSQKHWTKDATDTYLCYQKIYSPRHRRGLPLNPASISRQRPLRVVLFNELPQGTPEFQSWMNGMLERYELTRAVPYPVSSLEKAMGPTWDQLYLVYEFVPRNPPALASEPDRQKATR